MKPQDETRPAPLHKVLLSFDDGPDPSVTPQVLDQLARLDVRAVFFFEGQKLASPDGPALLERASSEGHVIGNHGHSHADLTQLSDHQIRDEIRRTEELIGARDGGLKLFRPAFGFRDDRVDQIVAEMGYTLMLWNVDSEDWNAQRQPADWVDFTVAQVRRRQSAGRLRSLCVLHDVWPSTAARLPHLAEELRSLTGTAIAQYDPRYPGGLRVPGEPPDLPQELIDFPVDEARVIARPGLNSLFVLNQTASLLWDHLAGGASVDEAAHQMAQDYAIPEAVAAADVNATVAGWRRQALYGHPRPEREDPGPWLVNYGDAPATAPVRFSQTRVYRLLDLVFRIRYENAALNAALHPRFANLEISTHSTAAHEFEVFISGSQCVLRQGQTVMASHSSTGALAYRLYFELVRLAHPGWQPMAWLHAACLGSRSATVALVANNGSGKSTLCAGLASLGYQVFADDRLFLDTSTQRPAAAPNTISLKRGSWPLLGTRFPELEHLPIVHSDGEELRFLTGPPPTERLLPSVTHLFFPRYREASQPAAVPLNAVQALERIAAADGWISSDPRQLVRFLDWVRQVRCFDLTYPDLDSSLALVQDCLSS